jgi:tetratricopeptide (TPR) repeat protein
MSTKEVFLSLVVGLFVAVTSCFSQTALSAQQQIERHRRQAQEYLKEQKPELAVQEFRALAALEPNNVDAQGNLGVLLFFQGAYADAIPPLRTALKLQPALWKIEALLGMAEKRTGAVDSALSDMEKAFPELKEQKIRIDTGMELIDIYSQAGDLAKAVPVVSALRELDPTNIEIIYTAYRIYSDLLDETRLSLIVVGPGSARTHQMIAHELARQTHTDEAIENYREALKINPNESGLHFELAEMLNSASQTEEAEKEYQAGLEANPRDEKSECRLGDIAARRNDQDGAHQHYARALELQPDDPEANLGMAKVFMSMSQPEKAEPLLKRAIQADPTSALAHFRLATVYRQTGRIDEAKSELLAYQKYKDMKEKLRATYRAMRLEPGTQDSEDADSNNK